MMYKENDNYDVEDVKIEDMMDGSGHPVLTVLVSLLGGATIGTGGTLLVKKLMNKDNKEKQLKRKEKKLEKLKRDAEKLGIDLSSIPEVEIPEDEELDGEIETETGNVKVEVKTNSKKNKKKGE